ncbi:HD domain-containing protein [Nitrospina gracilis]|uniref:HD domain-containing protein n=1 Tax=Nitrospina gracilis TaxID=35801 RepID=UPI001F321267|nr:HD domain-containing protein [Nitrospina gracilis]MCF8719137.1 HD superfamily phosphohydrolase [Nitrospina gracilis Nb-211]
MGLAYHIFPGLDYSRFAHSIGVCHVTGRILSSLKKNSDIFPLKEEKEFQLYRLAGLLHDIGHYPFSHTMEKAVENYYSEGYLKQKTASTVSKEKNPTQEVKTKKLKHELLGRYVLSNDPELKELFKLHQDFNVDEVISIFTRQNPNTYTNLISSDLDADRIDYLKRTAHHSGLPYGSVDLDYLLSQIQIDKDKRICLTQKALRTADHFLLSRYFDYQQLIYHKTIAGLEHLLEDVIYGLLKHNYIDCSHDSLLNLIKKGEWSTFDDPFIVHQIRKMKDEVQDENLKIKIEALLKRQTPKLVGEVELFDTVSDSSTKDFKLKKRVLEQKVDDWSRKFGIHRELWFVWSLSGRRITGIGSHIPTSDIFNSNIETDKYEQAIRILSTYDNSSKPIMDIPHSLMSVLSNYGLYILRLYVLLPEEKKNLKEDIIKKVKKDFPEYNWK